MIENDVLRVCMDLLYGSARIAAAVEKRDRQGYYYGLPGPASTLDGLCSLLESLIKGFPASPNPVVSKSTLPHLLENLTAAQLSPHLTRQIARLRPEDRRVIPALVDELRSTPWEHHLEEIYPMDGLWREVRLRVAEIFAAVDLERPMTREPEERSGRGPTHTAPLGRAFAG